MVSRSDEPSFAKIVLTALLAWLVPGLGHIYAGRRRRGTILLITIAATFWAGVAIGGVQSTIQPTVRSAWFIGQMCTGGHALAAWAWGRSRAATHPVSKHPNERAGFLEEDVAVIYTGVAGMLNILIIIDALASMDPKYVPLGARPPPRIGHTGDPAT